MKIKLLTHGSSRFVLLIGNYAIKFPRIDRWRSFLHGLLANLQEIEFSRTRWPELCPVLFYLPLGFLVVMPRCEPVHHTELSDDDYHRLTNQPDRCIPAEWKPDSWGRLPNGSIVALDYG